MLRKGLHIFFLFLAIAPCIHSQTDSLIALLSQHPADTIGLKILTDLSETCEEDSIPNYTTRGFKLSDELLEKFPHQEKPIMKYKARLYSNQAYFIQTKGDVAGAINFYVMAMKIFEQYNDIKDLSATLNNIGTLYQDENNFKKALEFYYRGLAIRRTVNDSVQISSTISNIGSVYYKTAQWDSALYHFREAAKFVSLKSAPSLVANILNNIGTVYSKQKQYDLALEYFEKAKGIWLQHDKRRMPTCFANIADIYFFKGDISRSIVIGEEAYAMAKQMGAPYQVVTCAELLTRSHKAKGNFEKALIYLEEYKKLQDSLINDEAKQALARAQLQYEYDKKEAVNAVKRKEEEALWKGEQRLRRITIYSICSGLFILVILSYYIFKRYRERQKSHLEISRQKGIIEGKQKEILDSIRYAKRIQQSLMPTERYIAQKIGKAGFK
jgi:tetratricopeptide (TPR) repeat protein